LAVAIVAFFKAIIIGVEHPPKINEDVLLSTFYKNKEHGFLVHALGRLPSRYWRVLYYLHFVMIFSIY